MNIAEAHAFLRRPGAVAGRSRDRRKGAGRNPPAAEVPQRRRPGVSDARPPLGHALRRRGAAHPARHLPGIASGGRLLRSRRAVHRPAQPRHRPPDPHPRRAARSRQHHPGGRARRRRDARRRSHRRPGSRRRRKRRPHRLRRLVPGADRRRRTRSLTARYLRGELRDVALRAERRARESQAHRPISRRPRAQPQEHRRRHSAGHDGRGHRRLRLRQIDAGARRDLQGARPSA